MRLRCAGRGCEHAASAHDQNGDCAWCADTGRCRGWAVRRRHVWRDTCWEVWHGAWLAWWVERERVCMGYASEENSYSVKQPTFKETLVGLQS